MRYLLLVCLVLAGCGVSSDQVNTAIEFCADHGGLSAVNEKIASRTQGTCNDGTFFLTRTKVNEP